MIDNTIAAAQATGARILLPGTIYNFGPDSFPDLHEESPQQAHTPKGRIRVEMERRLEQAAASGVPVLIVRAGDFIGPGAGGNWFSQGVIRKGRPVTAMSLPGTPGVGHSWAYLPDVAETMVRLLAPGRRCRSFARYHMRGIWDEDGTALVDSVRRVTGRAIATSRLPWWALRLAAPFHRLSRELAGMRYVWQGHCGSTTAGLSQPLARSRIRHLTRPCAERLPPSARCSGSKGPVPAPCHGSGLDGLQGRIVRIADRATT